MAYPSAQRKKKGGGIAGKEKKKNKLKIEKELWEII